MPRLFFTDTGACASPTPAPPRRAKNWRQDFINAVRSFRDPSTPSQRIGPRHIGTTDAAPVRRATTADTAPAYRNGREMTPASVRTRDAATDRQQVGSPNLTEPTDAARLVPRPGENSDAELVASYPPAHKRNSAGGSYNLVEDAEGAHLYFLPGVSLDFGTTTASGFGTTLANGTGAATMDGKVIRSQDFNPVTRDTNAKNRAFWARQQGR